MSGRRVRGFLLLVTLGALGWWIYAKRPTVAGMVDTMTRPIFGTSAAVRGSERNRVVGEATQVISLQDDRSVEALRAGMIDSDVRRLLGKPDEVDVIERGGKFLSRWTYRDLDRVVVFEGRRVVSISVR